MNKILKLSAIALLASSTSLMAQSKSFDGRISRYLCEL